MPRKKPSFNDFKHLLKGVTYSPFDEDNFIVNTLIELKCNNGHLFKITIANIKANKQDPEVCPHCLNIEKRKQLIEETGISREEIEKIVTPCDFTLVSEDKFFKHNEQKVIIRCNKCNNLKEYNTPKYILTLASVSCDNNCQKRISIDNLEKEKIIINNPINTFKLLQSKDISNITNEKQKLYEDNDWHIVEYKGARQKGTFQCKRCGNIKKTFPSNVVSKYNNNNNGCKQCVYLNNKKLVNEQLTTICKNNELVTFFENYKDIDTKMSFGCKRCGEKFEFSWREINRRYSKINCPFCTKTNKRGEQTEVYEFIKSIYSKEIIYEDHNTIKPLQLDIYLPELKLAIEYCGTIWHSTKYIEDVNYHKNKLEICNKQGIRLLTIFSDEWKNKKEIVKSRISNCLGLSNIIFARKCEVTPITNKIALDFCEQYHIQGKGQCYKAYGLFLENKLISVMTFSKPMICKSANGYDYELNRFCTVPFYVITGGASRLFKAFLNDNKNIHVISFCDLRWGTGNVYKQLGMKQLTTTRPNYYYVGQLTNWERKHRFNFTKKILLEKFPTNVPTTEFELAEKNGLYRIYDCGHLKFSLKN